MSEVRAPDGVKTSWLPDTAQVPLTGVLSALSCLTAAPASDALRSTPEYVSVRVTVIVLTTFTSDWAAGIEEPITGGVSSSVTATGTAWLWYPSASTAVKLKLLIPEFNVYVACHIVAESSGTMLVPLTIIAVSAGFVPLRVITLEFVGDETGFTVGESMA